MNHSRFMKIKTFANYFFWFVLPDFRSQILTSHVVFNCCAYTQWVDRIIPYKFSSFSIRVVASWGTLPTSQALNPNTFYSTIAASNATTCGLATASSPATTFGKRIASFDTTTFGRRIASFDTTTFGRRIASSHTLTFGRRIASFDVATFCLLTSNSPSLLFFSLLPLAITTSNPKEKTINYC